MTTASTTTLRFRRLLLTGAAGNLGRELRPRLKAYCDTLRLSHRKDFGPAGDGEEIVLASLGFSIAFLMCTRNDTASAPSTRRWS